MIFGIAHLRLPGTLASCQLESLLHAATYCGSDPAAAVRCDVEQSEGVDSTDISRRA